MEFQFMGSTAEGRRFRKVDLQVSFARDGQPIGSDSDPVVCQISPFGTFAKDGTSKEVETKTFGTATAGLTPGLLPATFGISGGFEKRTVVDRKKHTRLHGARWIEGREWGPQNAARWMVSENENQEDGIPSKIRTAILVKPRSEDGFLAKVTIKAVVGLLYSLRKLFGEEVVDPVLFGAESERVNLGSIPDGVVADNLSACNLDALGGDTIKSGWA